MLLLHQFFKYRLEKKQTNRVLKTCPRHCVLAEVGNHNNNVSIFIANRVFVIVISM